MVRPWDLRVAYYTPRAKMPTLTDAPQLHPEHPPSVLIANAGEWSARALESVLAPAGYSITQVSTSADVLAVVRRRTPDLIFLSTRLRDGSGIDLTVTLREDLGCGPGVPIIVTSDERMSRGARLAALEAGAWLTLTYPFDAEELIAQLRAYAPARRSITQLEEASLIDPNTKLYSRQGLEQRARELHAQAGRHREPLACVIFTPVPTQGAAAVKEAVSLWGRALKTAGRQSDAIGRYGEAEFAVLAPNTDVDGALTMAHRLAAVLRSSSTVKGERRFEVRAGYEALEDIKRRPTQAEDLLQHAARALAGARSDDSGGWIRGNGGRERL